ncbi:MAG: hypothetical protein H0X26_01925 [Alphaproteobacteria bacterium]|nr:hypothetical protein [Alphaproteobacteria bacterium]
MKFITILLGVLTLSSAVLAVEAKENFSPTNKGMQEMSSEEKLKLLKEVQPHNTIFDNHHTGGIPYEQNK